MQILQCLIFPPSFENVVSRCFWVFQVGFFSRCSTMGAQLKVGALVDVLALQYLSWLQNRPMESQS